MRTLTIIAKPVAENVDVTVKIGSRNIAKTTLPLLSTALLLPGLGIGKVVLSAKIAPNKPVTVSVKHNGHNTSRVTLTPAQANVYAAMLPPAVLNRLAA